LELAKHLEYLHTAQTMGFDRVTYEAQELAFKIKMRVSQNSAERDLIQVAHDLALLLKIADLQATDYEVHSFSPRINEFVALCDSMLKSHGLKTFDNAKIRALISTSIDYYVMALMRNKPMVEKTLALLGMPASANPSAAVAVKHRKHPVSKRQNSHSPASPSADTAVLVAGGYHTAMLTQLLRENNVSYLVVTPTVDQISEKDHEIYVKRLAGTHLTNEEITRAASSARALHPGYSPPIRDAEFVRYTTTASGGVRGLPVMGLLNQTANARPDVGNPQPSAPTQSSPGVSQGSTLSDEEFRCLQVLDRLIGTESTSSGSALQLWKSLRPLHNGRDLARYAAADLAARLRLWNDLSLKLRKISQDPQALALLRVGDDLFRVSGLQRLASTAGIPVNAGLSSLSWKASDLANYERELVDGKDATIKTVRGEALVLAHSLVTLSEDGEEQRLRTDAVLKALFTLTARESGRPGEPSAGLMAIQWLASDPMTSGWVRGRLAFYLAKAPQGASRNPEFEPVIQEFLKPAEHAWSDDVLPEAPTVSQWTDKTHDWADLLEVVVPAAAGGNAEALTLLSKALEAFIATEGRTFLKSGKGTPALLNLVLGGARALAANGNDLGFDILKNFLSDDDIDIRGASFEMLDQTYQDATAANGDPSTAKDRYYATNEVLKIMARQLGLTTIQVQGVFHRANVPLGKNERRSTQIVKDLLKLSDSARALTFLLLNRHVEDKQFLEDVLDDSGIDVRVRLYAMGLQITHHKETRMPHDLQMKVNELYKQTVTGSAQSLTQTLVASPMARAEMQVNALAQLIWAQEGPIKGFRISAHFGDHIASTMGARLRRHLDNADSSLEFGTDLLKQLTNLDLYMVAGHEWVHRYLFVEYKYDGSTIQRQAIHELMSDLYAKAYARRIGADDSHYSAVMRQHQNGEDVFRRDHTSSEQHEAARAVISFLEEGLIALGVPGHLSNNDKKLFELLINQGYFWEDLFEMGLKILDEPGPAKEDFHLFVETLLSRYSQKNAFYFADERPDIAPPARRAGIPRDEIAVVPLERARMLILGETREQARQSRDVWRSRVRDASAAKQDIAISAEGEGAATHEKINERLDQLWADHKLGRFVIEKLPLADRLRSVWRIARAREWQLALNALRYDIYLYGDNNQTVLMEGIDEETGRPYRQTTHAGISTGAIHLARGEYNRLVRDERQRPGHHYLAGRIGHEATEIILWRREARRRGMAWRRSARRYSPMRTWIRSQCDLLNRGEYMSNEDNPRELDKFIHGEALALEKRIAGEFQLRDSPDQMPALAGAWKSARQAFLQQSGPKQRVVADINISADGSSTGGSGFKGSDIVALREALRNDKELRKSRARINWDRIDPAQLRLLLERSTEALPPETVLHDAEAFCGAVKLEPQYAKRVLEIAIRERKKIESNRRNESEMTRKKLESSHRGSAEPESPSRQPVTPVDAVHNTDSTPGTIDGQTILERYEYSFEATQGPNFNDAYLWINNRRQYHLSPDLDIHEVDGNGGILQQRRAESSLEDFLSGLAIGAREIVGRHIPPDILRESRTRHRTDVPIRLDIVVSYTSDYVYVDINRGAGLYRLYRTGGVVVEPRHTETTDWDYRSMTAAIYTLAAGPLILDPALRNTAGRLDRTRLFTRLPSELRGDSGNLNRRNFIGVITAGALTLGAEERAAAQTPAPRNVRQAPQARFLNDLIAKSGGVDVFIAAHAELSKSVQLRGIADPAARERIAKAYALYLFFRSGGFSGYAVAYNGSRVEDYIAELVRREVAKLGVLDKARYLVQPRAVVNKITSHINEGFRRSAQNSDFLREHFVNSAYMQSMTPLTAYALIGAYIRHFGVSNDIRLTMDAATGNLLLQVNIGLSTPLFIRVGEGASQSDSTSFDTTNVGQTTEPTLAAIRNYDMALPYLKGVDLKLGVKDLPPQFRKPLKDIAPHFLEVEFLSEIAAVMAPILFQADALTLYSLPDSQARALTRLKEISAILQLQAQTEYLERAVAIRLARGELSPGNIIAKMRDIQSEMAGLLSELKTLLNSQEVKDLSIRFPDSALATTRDPAQREFARKDGLLFDNLRKALWRLEPLANDQQKFMSEVREFVPRGELRNALDGGARLASTGRGSHANSDIVFMFATLRWARGWRRLMAAYRNWRSTPETQKPLDPALKGMLELRAMEHLQQEGVESPEVEVVAAVPGTFAQPAFYERPIVNGHPGPRVRIVVNTYEQDKPLDLVEDFIHEEAHVERVANTDPLYQRLTGIFGKNSRLAYWREEAVVTRYAEKTIQDRAHHVAENVPEYAQALAAGHRPGTLGDFTGQLLSYLHISGQVTRDDLLAVNHTRESLINTAA
jgi:hypothetical protein